MSIMQQTMQEVKPDIQHQIAHVMIESGIFYWVIGLALIGALTVFRKRILQWLGIEVIRKKK